MKGVKDTSGKPRLDLVPYEAVAAIAEVRQYGNDKYQDPSKWYTEVESSGYSHNQQKVLDFVAAAMRHCFKYTDSVHYKNRTEVDEESGLHHLHHAACSLAIAVALQHKGEES